MKIVIKIFGLYLESEHLRLLSLSREEYENSYKKYLELLGLSIIECKI
jgi:hypothetical protein